MSTTRPLLADDSLPGIWRDADAASALGQRWALALTGAKVAGGVLAALSGILTIQAGAIDVAAWLMLIGFFVALISELASWIFQPERDWYDGRAVAESAKTLAWRYAVGADPFPATMSREVAEKLYSERMSEVADQVSERIVFGTAQATVTPRMNELRDGSFPERKSAYIEGRTLDQHRWYAGKARLNRHKANEWRLLLIVAETVAVVLAFGLVLGAWDVDFAGLLASMIAAGAAWVAVKQFSPLASAYSVATKELALQATKLRDVAEDRWAIVAADAEEAISREHTTWVASRTGRASLPLRRQDP
jgi:hypothetical protein